MRFFVCCLVLFITLIIVLLINQNKGGFKLNRIVENFEDASTPLTE